MAERLRLAAGWAPSVLRLVATPGLTAEVVVADLLLPVAEETLVGACEICLEDHHAWII